MSPVPALAEWSEPQTTPDIQIPTQVLARLPLGWHSQMGSVAIRWGLDRLPVRR